MREIRVLHVIASSRGGGAEHVRELVQGLSSRGCRSSVVMPADGGNVSAADFPVADFFDLPLANGFSITALVRLGRLIARGRYDIVHCHGMRGALFGRLAASIARPRPVVLFTIHGFAAPHYRRPKRQLLLGLERLLQYLTDGWICVSEAERESFLRSGLADSRRVTVIRNGIDVDRFGRTQDREQIRQELGIAANAFTVITVCRLNRPRDFGTLLDAFARLSAVLPAARLLIVGDGPLRTTVEQDIVSRGLSDHVALLGTRQRVPEILHAADAFVLSSAGWEGLPLTVLEAQAAGLPVVASDVGGTREALLDGCSGWLFAPGDAQALAGYLLALARNPEQARQMGACGMQYVREHMRSERMVEETIKWYRQWTDGVEMEAE